MLNLLTGAFSTSDLYLVLFMLLPIVLGIFAAKIWNPIHGIITYFLFSYLIVYVIQFEGVANSLIDLLGGDIIGALNLVYLTFASTPVTWCLSFLADISFLNELLSGDMAHHIYLGVILIVYILSQILASILRKRR